MVLYIKQSNGRGKRVFGSLDYHLACSAIGAESDDEEFIRFYTEAEELNLSDFWERDWNSRDASPPRIPGGKQEAEPDDIEAYFAEESLRDCEREFPGGFRVLQEGERF
jgi:hypothetical protein